MAGIFRVESSVGGTNIVIANREDKRLSDLVDESSNLNIRASLGYFSLTIDIVVDGKEFYTDVNDLRNIDTRSASMYLNFSDGIYKSSFSGTDWNDVLIGSQGETELRGNDGNDRLVGGRGNDTLIGDFGNDILEGGRGQDKLSGKSGPDGKGDLSESDRFIFDQRDSLPEAPDRITDFRRGDKIDLRSIDANTVGALGDQKFRWVDRDSLASDFTGRARELRYDNGLLSGDTDGDRVADFAVEVRYFGEIFRMRADDVLL